MAVLYCPLYCLAVVPQVPRDVGLVATALSRLAAHMGYEGGTSQYLALHITHLCFKWFGGGGRLSQLLSLAPLFEGCYSGTTLSAGGSTSGTAQRAFAARYITQITVGILQYSVDGGSSAGSTAGSSAQQVSQLEELASLLGPAHPAAPATAVTAVTPKPWTVARLLRRAFPLALATTFPDCQRATQVGCLVEFVGWLVWLGWACLVVCRTDG